MLLEIKNFQFIPPTLIIPKGNSLIIKVLKIQSTSQIYFQGRYFILTIQRQDQENEEIETPPLYENQSFTHQFLHEGKYIIQCVNSVPFKGVITVVPEDQIILATQQISQQQIRKEHNKQQKIDIYAPENRKLKILGNQGTNMAPISILEKIKEKCLYEDTNVDIIDIIINNKTNSNVETTSTFNSSFQQTNQIITIKTDTYSDSGQTLFGSILDRKSSDPLSCVSKLEEVVNLKRYKQSQLSRFDKIQQFIVESSVQYELKYYECEIVTRNLAGKSILDFLEQGIIFKNTVEFFIENLKNNYLNQ